MISPDQLTADLKTAMLARDTLTTSTLRMIKAAFANQQIALGRELTDPEQETLLRNELKKRHEAAEAFTNAGRAEQALSEKQEAEVLKRYLPKMLSVDEIRIAAQALIVQQPEAKPGPLTGQLVRQLGPSADGGEVGRIVRELLS